MFAKLSCMAVCDRADDSKLIENGTQTMVNEDPSGASIFGPEQMLSSRGDEGDRGLIYVTLERKPSSSLGLRLDFIDGTSLLLVELLPGAERGWEAFQPADAKLALGDRIVEVNGVYGSADRLLEKLRQDSILKMVIVRTRVFTIVLKKEPGDSLGLEVSYKTSGAGLSLLVDVIRKSGLLDIWNVSNPHDALHVGDRIICVNDTSDSALNMLGALRSDGHLKLLVVACSSK
eukprot:TRINITY_DN74587_c0_g1_i1.p1 TRINITY_DN74587_c0_g1~~TRINITY_DN74587_c0_g1_i1.p1  ORF type:complete len:232 (+),score=35.15 TRINITY_DN74587_c0_g1_i1:116-811(+)